MKPGLLQRMLNHPATAGTVQMISSPVWLTKASRQAGGNGEAFTLAPLEPQRPDLSAVQVVPAGWWQAARSLGAWSLVTCCVGPGFDFADFELLRDRAAGSALPGADPALC